MATFRIRGHIKLRGFIITFYMQNIVEDIPQRSSYLEATQKAEIPLLLEKSVHVLKD